MDVALRRACGDDLAEVIRLLADDELGRERESDFDSIDARYRQAFAAIDADDRQLLIVAEHEGVIVGTMQLSFVPSLTYHGAERTQIEGVRVDSRLRGQGVGRSMIEWAIEQARRRGCQLVQLTTDRRRAEARRFYESLGFAATHEGMKYHLR